MADVEALIGSYRRDHHPPPPPHSINILRISWRYNSDVVVRAIAVTRDVDKDVSRPRL